MQNELLIKILEALEEIYPEGYSVSRLTEKLGIQTEGEFHKIIKYLFESNKSHINFKNGDENIRNMISKNPSQFGIDLSPTPLVLNHQLESEDKIYLTNEGIDFFNEKDASYRK